MLAGLLRICDKGIDLAAYLGAAGLIVTLLVTTADVIGRALGHPVYGAGDVVSISHVPALIGDWLTSLPIGPYGILLMILITYLVLGTFMEGYAMLVLTMPIFFPVVVQLGFDPIWFGVVVVLMLEMGLITPPVGMNVFIVKSVAPSVPLVEIFSGVWPFLLAMGALMALLITVPDLALLLPNTMFGVN